MCLFSNMFVLNINAQLQNVMRLILDWLMAIHQIMEELRYALVDFGAQYVMTIGI